MKNKVFKFWSRPTNGGQEVWTELKESGFTTKRQVREWAIANDVVIVGASSVGPK